MINYASNANDILKTVMEQTEAKTEQAILGGLMELVEKKLLVVHRDAPVLVESYDPTTVGGRKFEVKTAIRLELKDQGYIQKLELENKELREAIDRMFAVVGK